jgi:hypothetical protein
MKAGQAQRPAPRCYEDALSVTIVMVALLAGLPVVGSSVVIVVVAVVAKGPAGRAGPAPRGRGMNPPEWSDFQATSLAILAFILSHLVVSGP